MEKYAKIPTIALDDKVTLVKASKVDLFKVMINNKNYGSFLIIGSDYRYFPANTHELTGVHYTAIGESLDQLISNQRLARL